MLWVLQVSLPNCRSLISTEIASPSAIRKKSVLGRDCAFMGSSIPMLSAKATTVSRTRIGYRMELGRGISVKIEVIELEASAVVQNVVDLAAIILLNLP